MKGGNDEVREVWMRELGCVKCLLRGGSVISSYVSLK